MSHYAAHKFQTRVQDVATAPATFLVQPVNFDEGDADRVVLAPHDCSVTSWRKRSDNGALPIITRR